MARRERLGCVDIVPQGAKPDGAGLHVGAFSRVSAGVAMRQRPGFRGLAPQYGVVVMASIGIFASRSGVFMKWFERMFCNQLIYKDIDVYAQKLWITL